MCSNYYKWRKRKLIFVATNKSHFHKFFLADWKVYFADFLELIEFWKRWLNIRHWINSKWDYFLIFYQYFKCFYDHPELSHISKTLSSSFKNVIEIWVLNCFFSSFFVFFFYFFFLLCGLILINFQNKANEFLTLVIISIYILTISSGSWLKWKFWFFFCFQWDVDLSE